MVTMRWNSLETAATGCQSPASLGLEAGLALMLVPDANVG